MLFRRVVSITNDCTLIAGVRLREAVALVPCFCWSSSLRAHVTVCAGHCVTGQFPLSCLSSLGRSGCFQDVMLISSGCPFGGGCVESRLCWWQRGQAARSKALPLAGSSPITLPLAHHPSLCGQELEVQPSWGLHRLVWALADEYGSSLWLCARHMFRELKLVSFC